jgi:hypothetical protein
MTTVYIHIGAPKTATSTLQAILARKSDKLLRGNVLYPSRCRHGDAHHVLVCDLIEKHQGSRMPDFWYGEFPRGQAWATLREEIDQQGDAAESVVISSELFFGQSRNLRPMLADISEQLAGYTVKIVCYLRRQDQLYSSFYNQDVKGARQWAQGPYQFYETHQIFQYNYFDLLNIWGETFGQDNIMIRPYEPQQWHSNDIVSDFCHLAGLPILKSGSLEKNESLGPNQLYAKQCLNKVGYDKGINDDVLRLLTTLLPEEVVKSTMYVHAGLYRRYKTAWQATNHKLSKTYLEGSEVFQQGIPEPGKLVPFKVDDALLADYLQELVRRLTSGKSPELQRLFSRAALLMLAERNLWSTLSAEQRGQLCAWS